MRFHGSSACALSTLLVALAACGAVAEQAGERASRAATEHIAEKYLSDPTQAGPGGERFGRGMIKGGIEQLDNPDLRNQFRQLMYDGSVSMIEGALNEAARREWGQPAVAMLSTQIADGVIASLTRSLGPNGEGEVARSLSGTAEQVAASSVRGFQGALFEDCRGTDRASCVDRRLNTLSRSFASGIRDELRNMVLIPLLAMTFLFGIGFATLVYWIGRRKARA